MKHRHSAGRSPFSPAVGCTLLLALIGCGPATQSADAVEDQIKREHGKREVELRVSTMPTAFGEKAVLRIFDPDILLKGIDELGLSTRDLPCQCFSASWRLMLRPAPCSATCNGWNEDGG